MFRPGFVLSTLAHLEAAQHNQSQVSVWQNGELIDYGGPIELVTDDVVMINGDYYLISVCEFRLR